MKDPDHPVPSGDRTMARMWLRALELAGASPVLATRFCSRDGVGAADAQDDILAGAEREVQRLVDGPAPAIWFTYHNYYKAPDLIGPRVAAHFGIPYVIAEGSSAGKRANGRYARFSALADEANRAADLHLMLNGQDRAGLEAVGAPEILALPPFIDTSQWPCRAGWHIATTVRLAAAAMMRPGDKLASYGLLAEALRHVPDGWHLEIAGDGPARAQVEDLFRPFGDRVAFLRQGDAAMLGALYRRSDLMVWPGVNEAFGMAYLEAAASGCPSLAMAYGGVGEVVADGVSGHLVTAGDTAAYAQTFSQLLSHPARLAALGRGAAQLARRRHDIQAAALLVSDCLQRFAGHGSQSCVS
ncbi:glycosyltransferase [Aureimonas altamirensis]|uniref:glycosyltransferase family 4 protein n=1 Tax=Aureimonas altamirensis TaxID=370622 RepID=UPI001E309FFD|nr:glycosyltransferase [Aureimonas altamirensis]UHD44233.1 glycosyltransferase [Aureimonas altamirensis]